jgi:hypothetical protein
MFGSVQLTSMARARTHRARASCDRRRGANPPPQSADRVKTDHPKGRRTSLCRPMFGNEKRSRSQSYYWVRGMKMKTSRLAVAGTATFFVLASVLLSASSASAASATGGPATCAAGNVVNIQADVKSLPGDASTFTVDYSGGSQSGGFSNGAYQYDNFKSSHQVATQTHVYADYIKNSVIVY